MNKIAIAIPYYNRSEFILETIQNIVNDDRVEEIIINDDCSDINDFNDMNIALANIPKIKIYRNEKNLGSYLNKVETIRKCTSEWVFLLDSDNFLYADSLDALYAIGWNKETVYYPAGVFINGKNSPYNSINGNLGHDRFCGDKDIYFEDVQDICSKDMGFGGLLNAGNCFANRDKYLQVCDSFKDVLERNDLKPWASDGIFFNYIWLINGFSMKVVLGLNYHHRVHSKSSWGQTAYESTHISNILMDAFLTKNKNLWK